MRLAERVREIAERHVGDSRVPGLVALVARGDEVYVEAFGRLGVHRRVGTWRARRAGRRTGVRGRAADAVVRAARHARHLHAFSRMLLRSGAPVLSADAVRAMTTDQLTAEQKARGGLGRGFFDHLSWGFCQAVYDTGAFGWNGGFGSSWLVDPHGDVTVVVLTQRLFERPEPPQVHVEIQAIALETGKAM